MYIVILCSEAQKTELEVTLPPAAGSITWTESLDALSQNAGAGGFVDLLFDGTPERVALLARFAASATVVVDSVIATAASIHPSFVRIAGWPTMLSGAVVEGATAEDDRKAGAEAVFAALGKTVRWVTDIAGFITPRVISTIINEAYFALADDVSTEEDIDTAMKLGTAYPYGPIEWGNRIGLQNIANLLHTLSLAQPRYRPSDLLVQETDKAI